MDYDKLIRDHIHICPGAHLHGAASISEDVLIRTGASTISTVSAGDRAAVGAGAAVTKDIPGNVIAAGVPARWQQTLAGLTCAWYPFVIMTPLTYSRTPLKTGDVQESEP